MPNKAAATPRALRINIAIIGQTNVGKSSLINAICEQEVAIVSPQKGTTTDAVAKAYEMPDLGAVTFFDTAGFDDDSELGLKRIDATRKVLYRADIAVLVIGIAGIQEADMKIVAEVQEKRIPLVAVFNKTDEKQPNAKDKQWLDERKIKFVGVSAKNNENIGEIKTLIIQNVPDEIKQTPLLVGDLCSAKDVFLLVTPIDISAPKGRLILPQVQVIREILDKNAKAIVVKETELAEMLAELKHKPKLVVADSQVVLQVAKTVPAEVPLTTFSILFARNKGDFKLMYEGAKVIDDLQDGDKILIAEACSHHAADDDIGKVKIPNLLLKYSGKKLQFEFGVGTDFPQDLEDYKLVIHCGACMLNRAEMVHRIKECERRGVAITNYGVAISKMTGVLDRAVKPLGF